MTSEVVESNPEFYKLIRSTLEPVPEADFRHIHGLVAAVVAANLSVCYKSLLNPHLFTVDRPLSSQDLADGIEYEDHWDGLTKLEGRSVDTRLLAPANTMRQEIGATAMVGIAASPKIPIANLWVMSGDGSNHWMIEESRFYSITDYEIERLDRDLSALAVR